MVRLSKCRGCGGGMPSALAEVSSHYCPTCCAEIVDACDPMTPRQVFTSVRAIGALKIQRELGHDRDCTCKGCCDVRKLRREALDHMDIKTALEVCGSGYQIREDAC